MDISSQPLTSKDKLALTVAYQRDSGFVPRPDVELGCRYPEAETLFGFSRVDAADNLHSLWEGGYLRRELHSSIMKCPSCDGYKLIFMLQCPYCNSLKLTRGNSVKHYPCGHIDFEDRFEKADELFCPSCSGKLEKLGLDYMRIGVWYKCLTCEKAFGEPKEKLYCPQCDRNHEREDLVLQPIFTFTINETRVADILLDIDLERLKTTLSSKWSMVIPGNAVGRSGIEHTFSIGLTSKGALGKKVFIDIEQAAGSVDSYAVMRFFAKLTDVESDLGLLASIPRFSDEARRLAETYGVKTFEGNSFTDVMNEIKNCLDLVVKEERTIWVASR